jgi:hypothetical protein
MDFVTCKNKRNLKDSYRIVHCFEVWPRNGRENATDVHLSCLIAPMAYEQQLRLRLRQIGATRYT